MRSCVRCRHAPTRPSPLHGAALTENDLNSTPLMASGCKELLASLRNEGMFTPPSLRGSLQNPGIAGGSGWGSGAINPGSHILIATYLNAQSGQGGVDPLSGRYSQLAESRLRCL